MILHIDFDAFFAAVEQREHPQYQGKPVIVGGTSQRGVVSTASYEAREFGIHSAMPMWQARRRCPQGIFVPPDGDTYSEYSRRGMEILSAYSPRFAPTSIDEAYVDVTGSLRLFHGVETICQSIKREVREALGITVSIGVSPNRLVSKMASDWEKPDGLVIVRPDELPERLFPFPVGAIPGVGKVTRERLTQMGVSTIGQLADIPRDLLDQHFGKQGAYLHRASHARDDSPVPYYQPDEDNRKQISRETTMATDTRDPAELERRLLGLSEDVGRRLRRRNQSARTITLKVKLSDFKLLTRSQSLDAPTHHDEDIYEIARELLTKLDFGAQRARLIGVGVSNLTDASGPDQLDLFDQGDDRRDDLAQARDAIANRFGADAITRARLVREPGPDDGFGDEAGIMRPDVER